MFGQNRLENNAEICPANCFPISRKYFRTLFSGASVHRGFIDGCVQRRKHPFNGLSKREKERGLRKEKGAFEKGVGPYVVMFFWNNLLDRVKGPAIPYTPTQQR